MALSTLGVAPTVGEKGVALKVGETAASHLQGHNWIILSGGRRYISIRKDEIKHCLSPSVKCVALLLKDMSLTKVLNS